jgi:hypothetical protein
MGYLDRLKKHVSAECPPDPLSLLPKALLAPLAVATGHVSRKQGRAIVDADTTAKFDKEWYEERAAIYEFDAGFSRQEAERRAYLEVTKWVH